MPTTVRYAAAILLCTATAAAFAQPPAPAPVEVMVLGTFHFGNPGADVINAKVEDVRAPRKQAELQDLARRLSAFKPTKIVIERQAKGPDFTVADYTSYTPAALATNRNENVQIGYRLASALGHSSVYGFDEQTGPGEPDYFPFDKVQSYATRHGKTAWLETLFDGAKKYIARFEADQRTNSISQLLATANDAATTTEMHRSGYYEMLKLGDGEAQPGADLNAMWYLRNAKMFAKVTNFAKPGDRVLIVVGFGHNYWLRHLASETPGFRYVDPVPYLEAK